MSEEEKKDVSEICEEERREERVRTTPGDDSVAGLSC